MPKKFCLSLLLSFLLLGPTLWLFAPLSPVQAQSSEATALPEVEKVAAHAKKIAQEATPSDTEVPEATSSKGLEEAKKRINKFLEEKPEQVKGVINDLISQKRALIGEVQRITDEALTIENRTETTILALDENIQLLKEGEEIEVDEIVVGDWATALGIKEDNRLEPRYILISSESLLPRPQAVLLGTITELSRSSLTVQPRSTDTTTDTTEITLTSRSETEGPDGEAAAFSSLAEDMTVLVTGYKTDDGIEASTIRSLAPLEE